MLTTFIRYIAFAMMNIIIVVSVFDMITDAMTKSMDSLFIITTTERECYNSEHITIFNRNELRIVDGKCQGRKADGTWTDLN